MDLHTLVVDGAHRRVERGGQRGAQCALRLGRQALRIFDVENEEEIAEQHRVRWEGQALLLDALHAALACGALVVLHAVDRAARSCGQPAGGGAESNACRAGG
eukprot:SAG11_NODE_1782_length_4261_cov_2.796732_2_plen_103_part_00